MGKKGHLTFQKGHLIFGKGISISPPPQIRYCIIFFNKLLQLSIKSIYKRDTFRYIIADLTGLVGKSGLLTHFQPMFHLRINQVVGFYQQNVTLPQVFFKDFASKNQLPGFYISGTLVENGLKTTTETSNSFS